MKDVVAQDLVGMSMSELDDLFGRSPAGPIPVGHVDGTVLYHPGSGLGEIAAKVAHTLFWKGKSFDPKTEQLHNLVLPTGIPAVVADVYRGSSWFDGKDCIVLDYSKTSLVAERIRDEIRLVAPGLYLGLVFWGRKRILDFALSNPEPAVPASA